MRVALVHDYLTQYGGAERVLGVLHEMFPEATVHTSLYDKRHLPDALRAWDIRPSPLQWIPLATRTHRLWAPLYPAIHGHIGAWNLGDVDVIVADTSAFAHHAQSRKGIPMVCYCYSPARFLYGDPEYLDAAHIPGWARPVTNAVSAGLRMIDRRAARKATTVVAVSEAVRERIQRAWGLEAEVIHPPVDTERFRPTSPAEIEDWYLVVSRLVPHKRIDRAIRATNAANVALKVIGAGRSRRDLTAIAGPTVEFLGELDDAAVADHMRRCKALILPGVEDFGLTAVEAQAAGRPVIAARGGGALETVIHGKTGFLFDPTSEEELVAYMLANHDWDTATIQRNAQRFRRGIFEEKMGAEVRTTAGKATSRA